MRQRGDSGKVLALFTLCEAKQLRQSSQTSCTVIPLWVFTPPLWVPSYYQLCLSRVLPSLFPPKSKLMAPSNVLPQTGGATQRAPSTLPAPDPTTITDDPLRPVAKQTHMEITTSWGAIHRYYELYFSEVSGCIHGPLHFAPDERVEKIQQWLEEETFHSRCVDEETNEWLAHVEISTSCGVVLDECRNLDEYPVCHGDTLTVFVVPRDGECEGSAEPCASQPAASQRL